jgi:hypothetical protein
MKHSMLNFKMLLLLTLICLPLLNAAASGDRTQSRLDQACEAARQAKLTPIRAQLVEECVANKERSDRAACERFNADYGNHTGNRAPLFMDLPECVEAFDYRQNNSR